VPSNIITIAALTQSIENELAWWRTEPCSIPLLFSSVSTMAPLRK